MAKSTNLLFEDALKMLATMSRSGVVLLGSRKDGLGSLTYQVTVEFDGDQAVRSESGKFLHAVLEVDRKVRERRMMPKVKPVEPMIAHCISCGNGYDCTGMNKARIKWRYCEPCYDLQMKQEIDLASLTSRNLGL